MKLKGMNDKKNWVLFGDIKGIFFREKVSIFKNLSLTLKSEL